MTFPSRNTSSNTTSNSSRRRGTNWVGARRGAGPLVTAAVALAVAVGVTYALEFAITEAASPPVTISERPGQVAAAPRSAITTAEAAPETVTGGTGTMD